MKAIAYIDGFNLYFRAVKGTPYKWLNLRAMCEMLVSEHAIERVKFYTAWVSGKDDPDKPVRQATYIRALEQTGCEPVFGKFLVHPAPMRLVSDKSKTVWVIKTQEKGSDVNLASQLLIDGFTKQYEVAIVVSNDLDLAMPIRFVRDNLGFDVIVINPVRKKTSKQLSAFCLRGPARLHHPFLASRAGPPLLRHQVADPTRNLIFLFDGF